ncbi:MAG TPA: hypothetical protein VN541_21690, partial [Tepidisphaeraceae bacterium]|nr:hypothetical protein [Tepidisphaeraceae bacterium]
MSPGVILAILAWCGCGLMFLLLWLEFRLRVLHPASLLFITLLLLTLLAPLVSAGLHLWRRIRRRAGRIGWTLVSFVPLALCAIWGAYAYDRGNRRVIPHNLPMKLINVAAASVEEAHLVYLYPHRIETPRLVMFYRDGLPDPQADAAAMDQHVARMEQLTDLRLRSKIFYVRGPLFDDRHVAFLGLAYGSGQGRAEYVDLHELAHAVIGQHAQIDSDPPTLLSEGWAESQSVSAESLAHRALSQRRYIA